MADYGSINIDFSVLPTDDPNVLLLCDTSYWKHIEDQPSIIEVVVPGSSEILTLNFTKNNVNVLNSNNLGITCTTCDDDTLIPVPDGIYNIVLKGSPDTYFKQKYHLRTVRLKLRSDKYYISFGLDFSKEHKQIRERLFEIDFMIKAAEASIRDGNVPKASEYYNRAKSQMDELEVCTQPLQ